MGKGARIRGCEHRRPHWAGSVAGIDINGPMVRVPQAPLSSSLMLTHGSRIVGASSATRRYGRSHVGESGRQCLNEELESGVIMILRMRLHPWIAG